MSGSNSTADAVFVIHQDTDLNRIEDLCRTERFTSVVILATHCLLQHERRRALQLAPRTRCLSFAELLSDSEMAACDERSSADLRRPPVACHAYRTSGARFMQGTRRYQNDLIYQKLIRMLQPKAFYFDDGLGIDARYWKGQGAVYLPLLSARLKRRLETTAHRLKKHLHPAPLPGALTMVSDGTVCYIFLAPPRRLRFSDRVQVYTRAVPSWQKVLFLASTSARTRALDRLMARLPSNFGEPRLATTIHQYRHEMAEIGRPLFLFVDGYHPPNYPRSYIDMFPDNCTFVVNHMFNAGWFQHHHRRTCTSLPFLQAPIMQRVENGFPRTPKTVLLALNHAGDWTSLVQRSDTDILLEAFAEAAENCADLQFIVRPHPTMADPAHEGIHSLERIRGYVAWRKLKNLHLSVDPIERDMQRGDVFVSEYSQVLIDALQNGKLGVIAHLTARRSFMKPYEELGFCVARTASVLAERIRAICANPQGSIEHQNMAVERYNALLKAQGYC